MEFFDTSNIPANLAKRSFSANLIRLNPNGKAPLFGLSGLAKTKTTNAIEHGWWTKVAIFPELTVKTGVDNSATSISITAVTGSKDGNIDFVVPGVILRHTKVTSGSTRTVELLHVTAVDTSGGTVTVVRGFGGTTAQAIATGDKLVTVGNAHGQGSDAPEPVAILPTRYVNNTQIFRDAWGNSETLAAVGLEVGDSAPVENKRDAMFFHSQAIEKAILFGRKGVTTDAKGRPLTLMAGIEQIVEDHVPSNIRVADSAGTTYETLETYLDPLLDFKKDGASTENLNIYLGKQALKAINQIGKLSGEYQIVQNQTSFGLRFMSFQTTRGTFNLIEHPLLNTNAEWAKMAFVVDTSSLDIRYLRQTKHKDIEQTGKDAMAGVYTTELTLEIQNPWSFGVIYNLTAGKASN